MTMNYHNITHDDVLNGDGFRVVLWVAGCEHHCKDCQNPCTWDVNSGIPFTDEEVKEIFHELDKPTTSGITYSGGDPMHSNNIPTLIQLTHMIKKKYPNATIWSYTGGTWENLIQDTQAFELIKLLDVLVDGEYIEELRDTSLAWVGSSNQRVIDVQETLLQLDYSKPILHCGPHGELDNFD